MAWHAQVLVVANVTATSDDLVAALKERTKRGPASFTLLLPAAGPGLMGRDAAQPQLEAALARWREAGLDADGLVGTEDPAEAVAEAWDPRRYDEVIVSTLPGRCSRWLRWDLPNRVALLTGVPVEHVEVSERTPPPVEPPPVRVREPLGPLSVLGWGRRQEATTNHHT